jgi:FtsP/CotA-like multicopper oxidase with cupredoxin domain
MKRRSFLQLAAGAAAAAAVRTPAFALVNRDQEIFLAIRDQSLGAPDAVRVRPGERVRFHFVHAGGSGDVHLHLPGHRFTVIALDGNPVPTPAEVDVLSLAMGERIQAMVEMNSPGNWNLGSLNDAERAAGLQVRVAYANENGPARWQAPPAVDWSYARFSAASRAVPPADQTIEMLLEKGHWIIDRQSHADLDRLAFQTGRRYRLRMMNATDCARPVHLHGYNLLLTRVNQIPVSGIVKDTVRLERYNVIEADVLRRSLLRSVAHSG